MADRKVKLKIALPPEVLASSDQAAATAGTSDERELMVEGYRAMAEQNRRLAEERLPAGAEVVLLDPPGETRRNA